MLALAEEESPRRLCARNPALIDNRLSVFRVGIVFECARKLPPERKARVVGDADLVGSVRFDPSLVLGEPSFVDLSSLVVVALERKSAYGLHEAFGRRYLMLSGGHVLPSSCQLAQLFIGLLRDTL